MKKSKIMISLLAILLLLTTTIQAASDSYETTLKVNQNQVKKGDTLTVTIGLDKIAIESGEKGIGAYSAKLDYDTSILEYVKSEGTENWEAPFFQNGLMTGNTKDGKCVDKTQSIGTITFQVKENAKIGETTIQLTNFLGSMGEVGDLKANNQSAKIKVVANENQNQNENNGNQNENNENNQGNNDIVINTNTTNSEKNNEVGKNNTTKDNSTSEGKLPQTGTNDNMILASIVMLVIVSVVSFVRYQKLIKKN